MSNKTRAQLRNEILDMLEMSNVAIHKVKASHRFREKRFHETLAFVKRDERVTQYFMR